MHFLMIFALIGICLIVAPIVFRAAYVLGCLILLAAIAALVIYVAYYAWPMFLMAFGVIAVPVILCQFLPAR